MIPSNKTIEEVFETEDCLEVENNQHIEQKEFFRIKDINPDNQIHDYKELEYFEIYGDL